MRELKEHFRHVFEELNVFMAMGIIFSKKDIEYLEEQVKKLNEEIGTIKNRLSHPEKYVKPKEDKKKKEDGLFFQDGEDN